MIDTQSRRCSAGPSEPHGTPAPHDALWAQAGRDRRPFEAQTRPCPQTGWSRSDRALRQHCPGPAASSGRPRPGRVRRQQGSGDVPAHLPWGEPAGTCCVSPVHTVAGRPLMIRVTSAGVSHPAGPSLSWGPSVQWTEATGAAGPHLYDLEPQGAALAPPWGLRTRSDGRHQRLSPWWTGLLLPDPRAAELGSAAGPGREGAGMGFTAPWATGGVQPPA